MTTFLTIGFFKLEKDNNFILCFIILYNEGSMACVSQTRTQKILFANSKYVISYWNIACNFINMLKNYLHFLAECLTWFSVTVIERKGITETRNKSSAKEKRNVNPSLFFFFTLCLMFAVSNTHSNKQFIFLEDRSWCTRTTFSMLLNEQSDYLGENQVIIMLLYLYHYSAEWYLHTLKLKKLMKRWHGKCQYCWMSTPFFSVCNSPLEMPDEAMFHFCTKGLSLGVHHHFISFHSFRIKEVAVVS